MFKGLRRKLTGKGAVRLPDLHAPELRLRDLRLPEVHLPEVHLPEIDLRDVRRQASKGFDVVVARRAGSPLWPTLVAAAGAGAAFWWWTQWARGHAEAEAAAERDARGGAEGAANPEAIMAHAPAPASRDSDAPDGGAAGLTVPAEDVMAHSPKPKGKKAKKGEVSPVIAEAAGGALDESLAVQGDADAETAKPKKTRKAD